MAVANLTDAVFQLPKRSNFRMPFHSQGSYAMGPIYPLKAIEMTPGDSIKINMSSLTRSNALKYATMANIRNEYHAFFVPYRILAHNFDNFNNLAIDESKRPVLPIFDGFSYLTNVVSIGYHKIKSSLLDQFDLPVFSEVFNFVQSQDSFQDGYDLSAPLPGDAFQIDFADFIGQAGAYLVSIEPFALFLGRNFQSAVLAATSAGELDSQYDDMTNIYYPAVSGSAAAAVLTKYTGKTSLELFDLYMDYCMQLSLDYLLNLYDEHSTDPNLHPVNFLSIWCYWRIVYDWYINTNIDQNVDTWEDWCLANFGCTIDTFSPSSLNFERFITPAERLFGSDYFTSAFLSTQNGTAVPIPSGGTLIDLRSAESEQTFREKLLYSGKRTIDQNRIFFGVTSSDARFDRAEILGSQKFTIGINSVSQTSASTSVDDPLGSYAGQGFASGSRKSFVRYRSEEFGLLILLMSYKPETIYSGVVDRLNLKTSPFDFLKPDFENVGEQGILQQELAYIPTPGGANEVFGFNRRFAEYMFINSSVHGSFKTTQAFMTLSRRFAGKPALNSEFIRINSKVNGLSDMFVAPDDQEQFNNWSWFEVYCTRPLSRFIEYGF